ncbi:MAG TPA: ATP-dependent sacrificial sulfur transferase LarE [Thermomicrobiales bacterium]|jgi:uncharacterized protein|nr:ATP-dependent sacrificial sulfur transferase LarE [Thermomicrobiales bacterium]
MTSQPWSTTVEADHVNASLTEIDPQTRQRYTDLLELVAGLGPAVVAFSGGVDSTFLLHVSRVALGDDVVAASGLSETYAEEEMDDARRFAGLIGVRYELVPTMEMTDPRYANNTHQRCYFCKSELYTRLDALRLKLGYRTIIDGANADDLADFRPGARAATELGVRSPLQEIGLTKAEIRALSRAFDLPTWDKPAVACLSSRFAYGDPITVEKLSQVGRAERALRRLGFRSARVRHHDTVARIEVPPDQLDDAFSQRVQLVEVVRAVGYQYVTLDLEGYRTGSQNEVLNARLQPGGLRSPGPV